MTGRGYTAIALLMTTLCYLPIVAMAQQKSFKQEIVGTWSIVSVDQIEANRTRTPLYGPNPKGLAIFTPEGRYILQLTNPANPKFVSNIKATGSAEENKSAVQGNLAHFGAYTVNETDLSFTLRIEGSSFPNWVGAEQKRGPVKIAGDELKWVNPTSSGGGSSELVWKRAK
jgi:hypothetical protein